MSQSIKAMLRMLELEKIKKDSKHSEPKLKKGTK